jgi:hypothetical protein
VYSSILGPVKEKVVTAWTKRYMHLGNTTTNRVESIYARLKLYIQNSLGDICKNWECISHMLGNQLIEIHRQFKKAKLIQQTTHWKRVVFSCTKKYFSKGGEQACG